MPDLPREENERYTELVNGMIKDVLRLCPRLKSVGLGEIAEWREDTVEAVRKLNGGEGRLDKFEICFHDNMARSHAREVSVAGFRNMVSLRLFGLYGDLSLYVRDIAVLLVENRHTLREIGFSLSGGKTEELAGEWRRDGTPGGAFDEEEHGWEEYAGVMWTDIWHKLCIRYVRNAIRLPGSGSTSAKPPASALDAANGAL